FSNHTGVCAAGHFGTKLFRVNQNSHLLNRWKDYMSGTCGIRWFHTYGIPTEKEVGLYNPSV
ncbi:MAG TPA: hypothetical protein VFU62_11615, partial [Hanamia sp.]|nr:hypothetical protein [Hanamia sp.]